MYATKPQHGTEIKLLAQWFRDIVCESRYAGFPRTPTHAPGDCQESEIRMRAAERRRCNRSTNHVA